MNVQINRGRAKTQNIENQYNYFNAVGTAFDPLSICRAEKYYESIRDSLYYPQGYLDKIASVIEEEHSILIQGEQGSGKSILSFKIAEQMEKRGLIASTYYLDSPSDWNIIKQGVQFIHSQEKMNCSGCIHLWIIDNLHKLPNAIEDFPDSSIWGNDYCIFCTRDLNDIPSKNDVFFEMALSSNQVFKRMIDKKMFLGCYNAMAVQKIGRNESDFLYQYIGGNLALLRYIITNGHLPCSLTDWQEGRFINFHSIYSNYFGFGTERKITQGNLNDTLRMLFLSQIDFPIPLYLQCIPCQTILKDFYFETVNRELEIEHASLAELLRACICKEYNLDYDKAFAEDLHWILSNLLDDRLEEQKKIRQINRFLQLLYNYKFFLSPNQILYETLSNDEDLTAFLEENACFISPSTWKTITGIVKKDSKINEIFYYVATSPQFIDTMSLNCDYDFQFIKSGLSQAERDEVEKQVLSHAITLMESIVISGKEVNLMHLLSSLSEDAAVKLIEQIPSYNLAKLLAGNKNGLSVFAHYYSGLENEVKNSLAVKISMDDYRQIFMHSASVSGFVLLLSAATDSFKKELCCLLTDGLVDRLVQNTIEKNYSIDTLPVSLWQLKKESPDVLMVFENTIGTNGYEKLLESQGTVSILACLIQNSSTGVRKELSQLVRSKPELVKTLLERTVGNGDSIGKIHYSLRELKKESPDALAAFEEAIGVNKYGELLESMGTVSILARLMQYSSADIRKKLSKLVQSRPELVKTLVTRTISEGSSIGAINFSLRELKKESPDVLMAFERAIGISGYEELLKSQGTVRILASFFQYSSPEMQKKLSQLVQSKPELVKTLLERTIREGNSIGALDLILRGLKKESPDALEAFENAIGINGYEELLKSQGTISILVRFFQYSSAEMREKLSQLVQSRPELVKTLLRRTINGGSSIGTFHLSLRELKKEKADALTAFERAIGVDGYEELLKSRGTISILARLMGYSSAEMQKELSQLVQSKPKLVKALLERTIREGSSIGTLNLSLKKLKKEALDALMALEGAIGANGYEELLKSQGAISILVRLIQDSSAEMQKELLWLLQSKPELVKTLLERTIKEKSSINMLNVSLKELGTENDSYLLDLETLIGVDGYLAMFSKCYTNSISILRIMACSSLSDPLVDKIRVNTYVWKKSRRYVSKKSCTILEDFNSDLLYAQRRGRKKYFDFLKKSVSPGEWLAWIRQGASLEEAILIISNLPLDVAKQISDAWLQNYAEVIKDIHFVEQQRNNKAIIDPQMVSEGIMSINNYNQQLSSLLNEEISRVIVQQQ